MWVHRTPTIASLPGSIILQFICFCSSISFNSNPNYSTTTTSPRFLLICFHYSSSQFHRIERRRKISNLQFIHLQCWNLLGSANYFQLNSKFQLSLYPLHLIHESFISICYLFNLIYIAASWFTIYYGVVLHIDDRLLLMILFNHCCCVWSAFVCRYRFNSN